jgi:hypothetical protein
MPFSQGHLCRAAPTRNTDSWRQREQVLARRSSKRSVHRGSNRISCALRSVTCGAGDRIAIAQEPVQEEEAATRRGSDALLEQPKAFIDKLGREPGPDDPVFFDPDKDVSQST